MPLLTSKAPAAFLEMPVSSTLVPPINPITDVEAAPNVGALTLAVKLNSWLSSLPEMVKDFPALVDLRSKLVEPPEPKALNFQARAELNSKKSWLVTPSPKVNSVVGKVVPTPTYPAGLTVTRFVPVDEAMVKGFTAPEPWMASVEATVFVPMLKYLLLLSQKKLPLF